MSGLREDILRTRAELEWLRARYDCGKVSDSVYAVIRRLETDVSWAEYRQKEDATARRLQKLWSPR